MGSFTVLANPARDGFDVEVVREAGPAFAQCLDSDSSAPFTAALREALESLDSSQVLNAAVALSNAVALLALSITQEEAKASQLVQGTLADAAAEFFPELLSGNDPQVGAAAEALICRVFGTVTSQQLPGAVDGAVLAGLAAYGDAGVMIADEVGLPRPVLAAAIGAAAAAL